MSASPRVRESNPRFTVGRLSFIVPGDVPSQTCSIHRMTAQTLTKEVVVTVSQHPRLAHVYKAGFHPEIFPGGAGKHACVALRNIHSHVPPVPTK